MAKFFAEPRSQQKPKREGTGVRTPAKRKRPEKDATQGDRPARRPKRDESISGSESDDSGVADVADAVEDGGSGSELENETGAKKRLRLAEQYLEKVRHEVAEAGGEPGAVDDELLEKRLLEDVAETKGRLYRHIADDYDFGAATACAFRAPPKCSTAIAACGAYVYTASKDGELAKWEIPGLGPVPQELKKQNQKQHGRVNAPRPLRRRPAKLASTPHANHSTFDSSRPHHTAAILCVAASQDGRFVATGGADRRLIIWSATDLAPLRAFHQHRAPVTGLAFRRGTNQLYSSSADRTVKTWDLDAMAYVETLFGHQDEVLDVAALAPERCLSAGAGDRTVRLWKVAEETQLVFRGGGFGRGERDGKPVAVEGSIERVAFVDDETFVSGSDSGALALWSVYRKKPVFVVPLAHGLEPAMKPEEAFAELDMTGRKVPAPPAPRWITALKAIPYSNLVLSGSWDGYVRAWKVSEDKKRLEQISTLGQEQGDVETLPDAEGPELCSAQGVINDIDVVETGTRGSEKLYVVAALGREHRLGRWKVLKGRSGALLLEAPRLEGMKAANPLSEEELK